MFLLLPSQRDNLPYYFLIPFLKIIFFLYFLQVVTGGHYDVDVTLKDPLGEILYDEKKKQYDSHTFTAKHPGT